jgi:hypothetical protein
LGDKILVVLFELSEEFLLVHFSYVLVTDFISSAASLRFDATLQV